MFNSKRSRKHYSKKSDWVLPIHAGPEIGVASTKAFLGQLIVLYILCLKISSLRKEIDKNKYYSNIENLKKLPDAISKTVKSESDIQIMAKEFLNAKDLCF